jgi:hypothetical protein
MILEVLHARNVNAFIEKNKALLYLNGSFQIYSICHQVANSTILSCSYTSKAHCSLLPLAHGEIAVPVIIQAKCFNLDGADIMKNFHAHFSASIATFLLSYFQNWDDWRERLP